MFDISCFVFCLQHSTCCYVYLPLIRYCNNSDSSNISNCSKGSISYGSNCYVIEKNKKSNTSNNHNNSEKLREVKVVPTEQKNIATHFMRLSIQVVGSDFYRPATFCPRQSSSLPLNLKAFLVLHQN